MDHTPFDEPAVPARRAPRRRVLGGLAALLAGAVLAGPATAGKGDDKDKGKGDDKDKPAVRGFKVASGEHEVTKAAAAGCNDPAGASGGRCTTEFGGTGTASFLGRVEYASSFTSDWSEAAEDEDGRLCAPVTGQVELTRSWSRAPRRGSLRLAVKGTVCQSDETVGYPLLLDGTYNVVGGTGLFQGATGQGKASGSVDGAGAGAAAAFEGKGKIRF